MPDVNLDLARPFYLIKILDKDTNDLKYVWSANIFLDDERPEDDSKIAPNSYIEDIEVKSNFEPPINIGEVKINHNVGSTPNIAINDVLKVYLGYYSIDHSQNPVYSLTYTGQIDKIKASLNHTIIRGSSEIKKITDHKRNLIFSRIMTIKEIIQKLAVDDGELELAQNGISDTTVSKQKGYGISKNLSIYKHVKKLADMVDFDVYMDVFDKFNARLWQPEEVPPTTGSSGQTKAVNWLSSRSDSENDVEKQLTHTVYFGVNTIDLELDVKTRTQTSMEIITLADSEGEEVFTIEPPVGTSSGSGADNGSTETGSSSTEGPEKQVFPRITKDDADKIAEVIVRRSSGGLNGKITVIGSPQIRLGDGLKIQGQVYGKKPFGNLNSTSTEFDASFTSDSETEEGGGESSSSSSSQPSEETLFKITGLKHLYNDNLGFITKLSIMEGEPAETTTTAGAVAGAETGVRAGMSESREAEFAGVAAGGEISELPITITNAQWDKEEARQGDIVTLTADVEGALDGTSGELEIFEHDVDGIHDLIKKLPIVVTNNKIKTTWEYEYHEDTDEIPTDEELKKYGRDYNPPEYFFVVKIGDAEGISGILEYKDYVEIYLKNPGGEPIADEEFILTLPDGSEIEGNVDSEGYAKVEGIPPGKVSVRFPNI
jgi:hypothetical protein